MLADTFQRNNSGQFFDDFFVANLYSYSITNDGTSGTVAVSTAAGACAGGILNIPTQAAANDYQSLSFGPRFELLSGCPVNAEIKLSVAEASANSSSWYFGLTDTITAGFLDSNGNPPASYHGAVVYKPHGSNAVYLHVSNGTSQTKTQIGTFTSGVPTLLGVSLDPSNGVTARVRGLLQGQTDGTGKPLPTVPLAFAGMTPMYLSAGVVASTTSAETLAIDYWGCDFARP